MYEIKLIAPVGNININYYNGCVVFMIPCFWFMILRMSSRQSFLWLTQDIGADSHLSEDCVHKPLAPA